MNEAQANPPPEEISVQATKAEIKPRLNTGKDNDKPTPVWDIAQESAFMETLMNQRFNFFLIFVGLILNAAVNSQDDRYFKGILLIGSIIAAMLAVPILRSHRKMDTIFKYLQREDPVHPLSYVDAQHRSWWSARWLLGWGIPGVAVSLLGLLAILALVGVASGPRSNERRKMEDLWKTEAMVAATVAHNAQEISALREQSKLLEGRAKRTEALEGELATVKAAIVALRNKQP